MNHEVTATVGKAAKKKTSGKRGKLRHMMLEPAENGVMATTQFHPPEGSDMYMSHPDLEEKSVHTSAASLKKHVASSMFGEKPTAEPVGKVSSPNDKEAAASPDDDEEG